MRKDLILFGALALLACGPEPRTLFTTDGEELGFAGRHLGGGELEGIKRSKNLRRFTCRFCELRDISAMKGLSLLEEVDLTGNPISDFQALRDLPRLTRLTIAETGFHDFGHLPLGSLVYLDADRTNPGDLNGLGAAIRMRELSMNECNRLKEARFPPLPALRGLSFVGTSVQLDSRVSLPELKQIMVGSSQLDELVDLPPGVESIRVVRETKTQVLKHSIRATMRLEWLDAIP